MHLQMPSMTSRPLSLGLNVLNKADFLGTLHSKWSHTYDGQEPGYSYDYKSMG